MATIKLGDFGYTAYADINGDHVAFHVEEMLIYDTAQHLAHVVNQEITVDNPASGGDDGGEGPM